MNEAIKGLHEYKETFAVVYSLVLNPQNSEINATPPPPPEKSWPLINPESNDPPKFIFDIIRLITPYVMDWRDSHTSIETETR